ncbi:MAG: excinuclease ABC subunit UvrA [Chlorobi bacterium]|nr:excinuclease ABC subunit UvrA [Chlorobiota bacterium]
MPARTSALAERRRSNKSDTAKPPNRPLQEEEFVGQENIVVRGAAEHNLKKIAVTIPRDTLTVITGLSGSGKSSLAFDTIYAEGQRRYVESLSPYARQFLGMMERPEVELIEGLSPAISIEQKTISNNPRSTVGTVTEIYDFLRLLFARVGIQHCVDCNIPVIQQSVDQILDAVVEGFADQRIAVLAPVVRRRKGHYRELFEKIQKDGFTRVRVDGEFREIESGMRLDRYKIHDVEIVVDRLLVDENARSRLFGSIEVALRFGEGTLFIVDWEGPAEQALFSEKLSCPNCNRSYDEPEPNSFSFNSPYGACPDCDGLGESFGFALDLIMPDKRRSLSEEGIVPLGKPRRTWIWAQVGAVLREFDLNEKMPLEEYPDKALKTLLHGGGTKKFEVIYTYPNGKTRTYNHRFEGIIGTMEQAVQKSGSARKRYDPFMSATACQNCKGQRLREESMNVLIGEKSIHDVVSPPIDEALELLNSLNLNERQERIARPIIGELTSRLSFLLEVGLHYLSLDRSARSLSGGESQRIRLATQIGSQLSGVLYVLDEPSIGLHQSDNRKLIESLKRLRDIGNTVLVVEHDREMIESSDFVVDLGPGAGELGGELIGAAPPKEFVRLRKRKRAKGGEKSDRVSTNRTDTNSITQRVEIDRSLTFQYLTGKQEIKTPTERRKGNHHAIILKGATGHNLKEVELHVPLGLFVCVTGLSGSGKSTLINETLYPALHRRFHKNSTLVPLPYKNIVGLEHINKVIGIDQAPIGRTPRSNPATYTGLFTFIRDLYAELPESKIRGYAPGRFSFNVEGGRCEGCTGGGMKKIEMNFLPDVYVKCEVCAGKRYNRETLEVQYKGKSIAALLEMTVTEALEFFKDIPRIKRKLQTLHDVGLGYIRLGQQATTLSGGEAQRVKLATELSKVGTGNTLYLLEEPTTGLHFEDVKILLKVLDLLVEKGNTIVVIEHNMDVIKSADHIIDLGPGGGKHGGRIIATGTPEKVARSKKSLTAEHLREEL